MVVFHLFSPLILLQKNHFQIISKFAVLGKRSLKRDKLLDTRVGLASLESIYGGEQPTVDYIDPDSVV